jgi:hypothetical protein
MSLPQQAEAVIYTYVMEPGEAVLPRPPIK